MSEIHTFPSAEARSPGRKPDVGLNQYKDRNTEEPYHSLSLVSLYRICQKLLCHLSSWIRGTEDDFNLFHYTSPVKI